MKPPHRSTYFKIGAGAAALLILASCGKIVTIPNEQLGVVRSFGIVERQPMSPGPHYLKPWERLEMVTMEYSDLNFVDDPPAKDPNNDATWITCATKDGFTIGIPVSVNWAINPITLTTVKARQPGYYTDREYAIIRSAVRDAVAEFSLADGSLFDRPVLQKAISEHIKAQTIAYYAAQGYGENSDKIVRYGLITLRGYYPPDEIIQGRLNVITATLAAQATAAKTQVPQGRSVDDYTKVIQALAIAKATEDGKAHVNIIAGNQPTAVLATTTDQK